MITRIVKMAFTEGIEEEFPRILDETKEKIRDFEGCTSLELLRDKKEKTIFFTYSNWDSQQHLDAYRHSPLFKNVWSRVSALFATKAEAWSLKKIYP